MTMPLIGTAAFAAWLKVQAEKQAAYVDYRHRYRVAHGFPERKSGSGIRA
jgi:hypothetical protein